MSAPSTWIKLDRNIMSWRWYTDDVTMRLFIHLLLKANIKESTFMNQTVKRGELVTSQQKLSHELGVSIRKIRTAMQHLESTGEIEIKTSTRFSIVSIPNYDKYQDTRPQANTNDESKQPKSRKKREVKKEAAPAPAEEKTEAHVPLWWEMEIPQEYWGRFSTEDEYWNYRQNGGE